MPVSTTNSRPSLNQPYVPTQGLPGINQLENLGKVPVSAQHMDGELNSLQDDVNMLADAINNVVAGNIPGSNTPANANKLLTTDGFNNLSFVNANTANISDGAITNPKMAANSVSTNNIINASVTADKINNLAITQPKYDNASIPTRAYIDQSVTEVKLATGAGSTRFLEDGSVTEVKLATGAGSTRFLEDGSVTEVKNANASNSTRTYIDQSITEIKLATSSISTRALEDGSVTEVKLGTDIIGRVVVACSVIIANYIATINYGFGVISVVYVGGSGTYYDVTLSNTYVNPLIITTNTVVNNSGQATTACLLEASLLPNSNTFRLNIFPQNNGNPGLVHIMGVQIL